MKFETAGATINLFKNADGSYTAYIYWKNPECEAEVCKKAVMPAYKINDCKFRLENGYILNQCEKTTEVEPVNIDKKVDEQLPLLDKIALKVDDTVYESFYEPLKNLKKELEAGTKKLALIGALGLLAFLYFTSKK